MTMEDQRLDRIEIKLDKLTEAVTAIARVEEKIHASSQKIDRLEYRLDVNEGELDNLKGIVSLNTVTVKASERIFWIIFSAFVSLGVYFLQ
jgi:DNA repair exonuclease SbcCD ATPase subunit